MKQDKWSYGWVIVYLLIPIIMIVLKAFGLIELSWLWILSPLWVPVALIIVDFVLTAAVLLAVVIIGIIVTLVEEIKDRE